MKIITVLGTRPQFVKAAVVSRAIRAFNGSGCGPRIQEIIVHTGQHYDRNMSRVFFEELEIPEPACNLNVRSERHGRMTAQMLEGVEDILLRENPDAVLVYGDTNSTLAGALAAAKLNIPIAHVEAGLRSYSRRMPEEINRCLTDHAAELLFCPTQTAVDNLQKEGICTGTYLVGDVMYDASRYFMKKAPDPDRDRPFFLATVHRAENTGDPKRLKNILAGLAASPIPILMPLHPRTRKVIERHRLHTAVHVEMVEPLPYLSLLGHLAKCSGVITDSGGLQKEAFFFGKRCLTLRDETEWVELVDIGANMLVGADSAAIAAALPWAMEPLERMPALYGNGRAAGRIVEILAEKIL